MPEIPTEEASSAGQQVPARPSEGYSAGEMIALPVLTCAGCGACCEEQGMPPGYLVPALLTFLPQALRDELAHHRQEEEATGWTRQERGLPCLWYDAGAKRCRHYEFRPERCRAFSVGGEGCSFWRTRRPPVPDR